MKSFHLSICFFLTLTVVSAKSKSGCSIILPDDVHGFSPVILTSTTRKNNSYKIFKPTGKITYVKEGFQLKLACAGKKNVFNQTTIAALELKCSEGNFVDANNNVQPLDVLSCKSIPISSMKITNQECANGNGYIYETGFDIDGLFYGPVFEICYDNITENTFYTHNILNGAALNYSISESSRRSFTADGMKFTTAKTNNFYLKKNQIQRFQKYFGKQQKFINQTHFLARGHLTADADFIMPYEQLATYYYVNVAPEFQAVNAGNWLRVEELGRSISTSYKDDINSYNGYMGILTLPTKDGDSIEIYLDDTEKIEVPEYYFKILLHRASDAAIVFVTVNNPYIENGPAKEICTNVCKESGIVHPHFPDVRKGYTFCCELKEFLLLVDSLPAEVKAKNLLKRKI